MTPTIVNARGTMDDAPATPLVSDELELWLAGDQPKTLGNIVELFGPRRSGVARRSMRAAWANFRASGDPSSEALPWPSSDDGDQVMSLVAPQLQVEMDFASIHHCAFWAAGADG